MGYLNMTLCGAALTSIAANTAIAQALYNVGVAPGRGQSRVTALTGNGQLAVGYSYAQQYPLSFRWSAGTGRADWVVPAEELAVSSDARFSAGTGFKRELATNTLTTLTPASTYNVSTARGIADGGTFIVGESSRDGTSEQVAAVAVRWNAAGVPTPLGYLRSNGTYSSAAAITPDGTTIVGASRSNGLGGVTEPFRWTAATGMVALQIPANTSLPSGTAYAVSTNGRYVAGWANGAAPGVNSSVPVRWNEAGQYQYLSLLPAYDTGIARGISGDGRIVVGQQEDGAGGLNRLSAFIWREGQGTMLLATYLRQQGVSIPSTVYLSDCTCISADGTVFGGTAFDSRGGPLYGFVAVVPAPGTSVLLAAGFAAVLRRRRAVHHPI